MKIYLDQPITIDGIEVRCTEDGLKWKIEHYERMLKISDRDKIGDKERQHIHWLIDNYKIHLQLYENKKQHG